MADLRKVEELDGPPIVGEDYLVLCSDFGGHPMPFLGAAHIDHFKPDFLHYHLDRRFLPDALFCLYPPRPLFGIASPFSEPWEAQVQIKVANAAKLSPPSYQALTCLRDLPEWHGGAMDWLSPNDTCTQARWKDGRPYCPHQGVPLAQFWDGEADVIGCPVHGLRVDMRQD